MSTDQDSLHARPFDVIHNALSDECGTAVEQTRVIMAALSNHGIGFVQLPPPPWLKYDPHGSGLFRVTINTEAGTNS